MLGESGVQGRTGLLESEQHFAPLTLGFDRCGQRARETGATGGTGMAERDKVAFVEFSCRPCEGPPAMCVQAAVQCRLYPRRGVAAPDTLTGQA